jgi:hypothetical protein
LLGQVIVLLVWSKAAMYHSTPPTVPDGNVTHAHAPAGWPVPFMHCGSSQSTFPSQLSSIPLSQIS